MSPSLKNQQGIALFIVLWVLALLSVIVGEFCHTMRTEIRITGNFKEGTQAYYIAKAGLNIAISELITLWTQPKKTVTVEDLADEGEDKIRWRVNAEMPPIPFGEGAFQVRIENESGKININRADQRLLEMMLGRFELEEKERDTITDAILDWRDKDDLHRLNGAENEYYQSLPEPYNAKNGDFDSVEELLLVKGMTPEIFHGGLREMVTVYPKNDPAEKVKNASRQKTQKKQFNYNKININAAPPQMLAGLPLMTEELVQAITDYRKEEDFTSLSQLAPVVGDEVYQAILPYLNLENTPLFTLCSVGTIADSRTRQEIRALVEINIKSEKKYRIVRWTDSVGYSVQ